MMTAARVLDSAESENEPAVLDEAHLGRMTLGDRNLEREILEIFLRQAAIMLERIAAADRPLAAASAHTLVGSARGIGAWRIAQAAERIERVASGGSGAVEFEDAVERLKAASLEAGATIAVRLRGVLRSQ